MLNDKDRIRTLIADLEAQLDTQRELIKRLAADQKSIDQAEHLLRLMEEHLDTLREQLRFIERRLRGLSPDEPPPSGGTGKQA